MLNHKPILQLFYVLILGRYMIEAKPFRPAPRLAHSSALVGTKLYFFGGYAIFYTSYEVFYLDLSEPFLVTAPPWKDISNSSGMPFRNAWGTTALVNNPDDEEDSSVYLIGGIMRDKENSELVFSSHAYMFNTSSGRWSIPEIKGTEPESRRNVKAVVDDVGKIYILCGYSDYLTGSETNHILHELISLNTKDLTWSSEAMINAPRRRDHYTATWLPSGTIVYIGGREFVGGLLTEADINRIHLYDTKKSTWSVMRAVSKNPIGPRFLHTAVLAPGDRIIICGGAKTRPGVRNFRVAPDIAVLNTRTSPFEWTVPQISSEVGEIPTLAAHTANLVGYYMIAAFGNVTEPDTLPLRANSKVYILDIRSFTWVNKFEPISAQSPLYSESFDNSTDNTDYQMFTVIGGILGVMLIGLLFVWNRREKKVKKK